MPDEMYEVHQEDNIDQTTIIQRHKKLMRKVFFALSGLFLVIYLPDFYPKYSDFDVINNAVFFRVILYLIMLYTLYLVLRYRRLPKEITPNYEKQFRRHYDVFDLSSFLVFLMTFLVFTNAFVVSFTNVKGSSMEPTLSDQDDLIIYHLNENYQRFDIVIVKIGDDEYYIKRLIGLPGDEIMYEDNVLYINGVETEETFINGSSLTCHTTCVYEVPENHYFVLGDSRGNSKDSRNEDVGFISEEDLFGRAIFRLRPFNRIGRVE